MLLGDSLATLVKLSTMSSSLTTEAGAQIGLRAERSYLVEGEANYF